jgi:hypothetical protein
MYFQHKIIGTVPPLNPDAKTANSQWPSNIREMSQDLLIAIFRGNEKLCTLSEESTDLLDMMAFALNQVSIKI